MYGIQTQLQDGDYITMFENDVKMYGIQTEKLLQVNTESFENDVKMYGIQTCKRGEKERERLRMM